MNPARNPAGWFEIYVNDLERAKTFYQNTFLVTLQRLQSPPGIPIELWAFPANPDLPGCGGAIVKMEGKDAGCGGTILYFSCVDCAVETARAAENGGSIHQPKFPIGEYGYCSLVRDPDGNMIGLHSMQ